MKAIKGGTKDMSPLGLLSTGEKAEIVEITAQKGSCHGTGRGMTAMLKTWGFVSEKQWRCSTIKAGVPFF